MTKPKRGGARPNTGPKTGLDAPPVKVTLLLSKEQAAYLRASGNASGKVRELIDAEMKRK